MHISMVVGFSLIESRDHFGCHASFPFMQVGFRSILHFRVWFSEHVSACCGTNLNPCLSSSWNGNAVADASVKKML